MTDMTERVARAIYFNMNCVMHDHDELWRDCNQAIYRDCARAAIEAMREPTEVMEKAGNAPWHDADALMCWQLMIDVALGEKP